jgi:predicted secreted hydrolase
MRPQKSTTRAATGSPHDSHLVSSHRSGPGWSLGLPGTLLIHTLSFLLIALLTLPAIADSVPSTHTPAPSTPTPPTSPTLTRPFARAETPREWSFPRDHAPHPEFQTEWWYITGNLESVPPTDRPMSALNPHSADQPTFAPTQPFGYQFTIFRRGLIPEFSDDPTTRSSAWATRQVYLVHLGLSDIANQSFHHAAGTRRPVLGMAGAAPDHLNVHVDGNRLQAQPDGSWRVQGRGKDFAYDLNLRPTREPLFHGPGGRDPKGAEPGQASYYYSMTRLETTGEIRADSSATSIPVRGLSWMDHEFMTSTLAPNQTGWDWFSAHLSNGSDLMLYQLRLKDGGIEPMSGGTLRLADGTTTEILSTDMELRPTSHWTSPHNGARYPAQWTIRVPKHQLELTVTPRAADQEMADDGVVGFSYYEGSVTYKGTHRGQPINGLGYMELTGYQRAVTGSL